MLGQEHISQYNQPDLYSSTPKNPKQQPDIPLEQFEEFLESQANQIYKLQTCFVEAIKQVEEYQRKERLYLKAVNLLTEELKQLRGDCDNMKKYVKSQINLSKNVIRVIADSNMESLAHHVDSLLKEDVMCRVQDELAAINSKFERELQKIVQVQKKETSALEFKYKFEIEALKTELILLQEETKARNQDPNKQTQNNRLDWKHERSDTKMKSSSNESSQDPLLQNIEPFTFNEFSSFRSQQYYPVSTKEQNLVGYPISNRISGPEGSNTSCDPFNTSTRSIQETSTKQCPISRIRNKQGFSKKPAQKTTVHHLLNPLGHVNSTIENEHKHSSKITSMKYKSEFKSTQNSLLIPDLPDLLSSLPTLNPPSKTYNYTGYAASGIDENRCSYKGMWKNGVIDGRGKLSTPHWTYDGQFSNGVMDGLGSIYLPLGMSFTGRFREGVVEGEGTLWLNDGSCISGMWSQNRISRIIS